MEGEPFLAQFALLEGKALERSPFVLISSRGRGECLYLLSQGAHKDSEACRLALEEARRRFQTSRLSLTGSLLAAAEGAHQRLRGENARRPAEERAGVGLLCALRRGRDLLLLRTGPCHAYLLREGGGVWQEMSAQSLSDEPCLGLDEGFELDARNISKCSLQRGDSLLLISRALEVRQLSVNPEEALPQIYMAAKEEPTFSALLLRLPGAGAEPQRGEGPWVRESGILPELAPLRQSLSRLVRLSLLLLASLLALILLGMLAWYLPGYWNKRLESRFASALSAAEASYQEASSASNREVARRALARAEKRLEEALGVRREDAEVIALRERIAADLARVNALLPLSPLELVLDLNLLERPPGPLRGPILVGRNAFLWERAANTLYRAQLDGATGSAVTVVMNRGEVQPGLRAGPLQSLLWMPPGGIRSRGELLFLDESRLLFAYSEERGLRQMPLRDAAAWSSLGAAVGFAGNLYILDPKGDQVWRYLPTEEGYDSERRGILENAELRDAIDLALDGNVYLLHASGKISKFVAGRGVAFSQEGIDRPLANPVHLFATAETRYLYVLDQGNQRIVVFGKDGSFQRQLTSPELRGLDGFFPDESQGQVYLLSGKRLYRAPLPLEGP